MLFPLTTRSNVLLISDEHYFFFDDQGIKVITELHAYQQC